MYFWLFTADVLAPPGPWICIKLGSMWTMALNPFHKHFMSSWFKYRKFFAFNFDYIDPIRSWMYTCHVSWNVVTCAKFVTWSGNLFSCKSSWIFTRFPLWAYKPLVKCIPGWSHTANPGTSMKWKLNLATFNRHIMTFSYFEVSHFPVFYHIPIHILCVSISV